MSAFQRNCMVLFIVIFALMQTAIASDVPPEDSENWPVNSAWVKELPALDQQIVLVSLGLGMSTHVDTKLIPAIKSKSDMQWVWKVAGTSNVMLAGLATRSEALRAIFDERSKVYLEVINGRIGADEFERKMALINIKIEKATASITPQQIAQVRSQYRSRLRSTETALIAFAKLSAK
ncbi:hypothetical protein N5D45_06785 [Stenotrophomonas sp. GD03819]|uniref:hypothetical protein n=1 Tax=Stenotrophomonas TaxID=40323 RepID=UPI00114633BB|nr:MULTISPECIES: hypothetical protein [Stenotrophomonas]MCD5965547.1 hypothetical protein [Stenotrophomonas maltophilia]MDH1791525.1 hypothetical protein [Stenotrophomonas sp. GD03819]QGL75320.1 hypothetical protein FEO95_06630 [Stenotrophomonas maltophilia]